MSSVLNEKDRELKFQKIKKKYKSIDLVINNAGYTGSIKNKGWITNWTFLAENSALNSFPFSGTIAVNQYLSVMPNQPLVALIVNFSFSISS